MRGVRLIVGIVFIAVAGASCKTAGKIVEDGKITGSEIAESASGSDGSNQEDRSGKKSSSRRATKASTENSRSNRTADRQRRRTAKITLSGKLEPNPKVLKNLQSIGQKGRFDFTEFKVEDRSCKGDFPAQPSVVVEVKESYKDLKFVPTNGWSLMMKAPGKAPYCQYTNRVGGKNAMRLKGVTPGTYRFYVATEDKDKAVNFDFKIENYEQPRVLPWTKADIPTVTLDGEPKETKFFTRTYSESEYKNRISNPYTCSRVYVKNPDLRIVVERRSTIRLGQRPSIPGKTQFIGPMPEDQRNLPSDCWEGWEQKMTLEPGTYYLRRMSKKGTFPSFSHYYIRQPSEEEPPDFARFDKIPKKLPKRQRVFYKHFPFVGGDGDSIRAVDESDDLRKKLLLNAPKQLFLAIRLDLDKQTAEADLHPHRGSDGSFLQPDRQVEYPKKGEPAILLSDDGRILTVDGSIFHAQMKDLIPIEDAERLRFPEKVRNPHLVRGGAFKMADKEDDAALLDKLDRVGNRYHGCVDRVWDGVEPRLQDLRDELDEAPEQIRREINRLKAETSAKAKVQCGYDRYQNQLTNIARQLQQSRTERRREAYDEVKRRLEELLK
jgi:hypothetical protein